MAKKIIFYGALLLVVLWIRQFFEHPEFDFIRPKPPPKAPQKRTTKKEKQLPQVEPPAVKALPQNDEKDPEIVEFAVVEGRAIAYGDIILGTVDDTQAEVKRGKHKPKKPRLWPTNAIPYAIDPALPNKERVENAVKYFNENTVLQFVPFESEEDDAIVFEPGEQHCYSYLGNIGGHQPIVLSDKCRTQEIMHEMMHALGFIHEHSRTDRDQYVDVFWKNIPETFDLQFNTVPPVLMEPFLDFEFDYNSIMLYKPHAFAIDKAQPTMKSKTNKSIAPVPAGLSPLDIKKIEKLYDL